MTRLAYILRAALPIIAGVALVGFMACNQWGCASFGTSPTSQPVSQVGAVNQVSDDDNAAGILAYRSELGIGAVALLALAFGVRPYLKHRRRVLAMKLGSKP